MRARDWAFWLGSLAVVAVSNFLGGNVDPLTLIAALTMLRSSYYGLGYAANDIVLVVLWVLASCEDPAYIPVAVNFGIFLFHDFYGFLSWKKRERHMAQTA